MKILNIAVTVIAVTVLLSGCFDASELENRGFVIALAIDKDSGNNFQITMTLADTSSESDKNGHSRLIKTGSGETLSFAIHNAELHTSQALFLGHMKAVILGGGLLEDDESIRKVLDALNRRHDVSKKTLILSANGSACDLMKDETKEQPMLGIFLADFFKNMKNSGGRTFKLTLEEFTYDLNSGNCVLVPKIAIDGNEAILGGAFALSGGNLTLDLDGNDLMGRAWLTGEAKNAVVKADFNGTGISMTVEKSTAHIKRQKNSNKITCEISVAGTVDGYKFGETISNSDTVFAVQNAFKQEIENEIQAFLRLLSQKKLNLPGLKNYETDLIDISVAVKINTDTQ